MGKGASAAGGGMPARQKGGGGFSPQMPSRYTGMPMNPIQGMSRGLPALGGKGGGYPGRQMPPYIDRMPMPALLPPRSYREMWESQQPAYQRPMPSIGASSRAMEAALGNQFRTMRNMTQPFPGAYRPPSGVDMGMRTQPAQRQMSPEAMQQARLMPTRYASGIASLGGGKGATRAAPQLGMRQYGTPTWSPLPAAQMRAIADSRGDSAANATNVIARAMRRGFNPDK